MTQRSTRHDTFSIERTYAAPPARVFAAWADSALKRRWFSGDDAGPATPHELDFRIGGRERVAGGPPGGPVFRYEATYYDIVPDHRIVSAYEMYMGDQRISVSVATVELTALAGDRTRLVYTEQGVFLDGLDDAATREGGTKTLLDKLAALFPG